MITLEEEKKVATISLCMIVRDEESVLRRCLSSAASIADEIIVVDTGSVDQTRKIALEYTQKVYPYDWTDDFSAARNFSFSKAEMEYCFWPDADDVLTPENQDKFSRLKETLSPDVDVVMMPYHTAFDSSGKPTFSYYRERLVRNCPAYRWKGKVHEAIVPCGKVIYSDIAVEHHKIKPADPDRNMKIYQNQLSHGETLTPREQFYYGRELYYHGEYMEAIQVFTTFLKEGEGWIENNLEACRQLSDCYRALGQKQQALTALLRAMEYDIPRGELCCDIGKWFFEQERWRQAAFWYETALHTPRNDTSGGFVEAQCYGYLPAIQLCVCYDRMKEYQKAEEYNTLAGHFQPDSEAYLRNLSYFALRNKGGKNPHALS